MKGSKATIGLILCVACFAILGNTSVRAYNVGVTTGYLKYDVNFSVSASGQSYSEGAHITVNITSVTDTAIEGTIAVSDIAGNLPMGLTSPFSSGEQSFSIDTTTWTAPYSSLAAIIIPAGLKVGDSVPGDGTVQSLTSWNGRTAVVINSGETLGLPGSSEFDQQTGVFLEASGTTNYEVYTTNFSIKLTETSLFSIAQTLLGLAWWIWAIVIVVIVGAILGALVLMRRRRQPSVQAPTTPPTTPPPPPPA
jgi:hypothetical protein